MKEYSGELETILGRDDHRRPGPDGLQGQTTDRAVQGRARSQANRAVSFRLLLRVVSYWLRFIGGSVRSSEATKCGRTEGTLRLLRWTTRPRIHSQSRARSAEQGTCSHRAARGSVSHCLPRRGQSSAIDCRSHAGEPNAAESFQSAGASQICGAAVGRDALARKVVCKVSNAGGSGSRTKRDVLSLLSLNQDFLPVLQ